MSGPPKRGVHEEAVHSSTAASMRPGFGGEEEENPNPVFPRVNFGGVQQEGSRPGYLPRSEARDGERRSPLNSVYKMPSSVSDAPPHGGHPVGGIEIRVESKDVRENKSVESSRDAKVEVREVHHQALKPEKEGRVDESKEGKYEEGRSELKGEVKMDKDVYGGAGSHSSWKEQHRVKKHPDVPSGVGGGSSGGGMTGFWMGSSQVRKYDAVKHASSTFVRKETDEAVGENRVDLKGEKERKRKEGKHHDWAEGDKDRSDFKSNVQGGSSSNNELKEVIREDKESEQWGRERKDGLKEKERLEERENDHVDRDGRSVGEKEGFQNDKEMADKSSVQENFGSEQKKPTESWRNMEREAKERRREREGDLEGERPEKRIKGYDKELGDGGADAEAATERDRDVFGNQLQQRKRVLRPRGSPQVANRDGCFKSRGQDGEGFQGKPEVSTVYKVGECMQELTKLWKEFETSQTDKSSENLLNGPTLEIRIPAEHVTATNRQVRGGQLWGTDIYTDDSDLVAVLMHTGYCRPTASPPPAIQDLRATIRVLPPQDSYVSTLRNNVRSRAWGAAIGCSYRVERCCIMKKGGASIDLEPCLTHTSTIEPTLAPVAVERSMTTRAAASNALRQQRFVREVTIQYNLCNEPWIKYSISIVADKGLKKPLYTSARLKKGEVLYLETHTRRYELCFTGEKIIKAQSVSQTHESDNEKSRNHVHSSNGERSSSEVDNIVVDIFRWSRCKKPLPQKFMRSIGIPLPAEHVEVLEENLDWEDVQWSQTGVWIAGKEYPLARVHFLSPN